MAATRDYPARKIDYVARLKTLFNDYKTILLVEADFVGSHQMQQVRLALREKGNKAEILMGKNTMVRQVIRSISKEKPGLQKLLAKRVGVSGFRYLSGNVGLVFTNDDAAVVRTKILDNKVPAAAKAGNIAPIQVTIPAGPTSMDPGQTMFFQSLNIPTKISKGTIEITSDVIILRPGDKVGSSEVALLAKLNIKPFHYGLKVLSVYEDDNNEGSIYDAAILDLSKDDLLAKFLGGVSRLTCVSLALSYPTLVSLPHLLANGFKKLLAVAVETEYTFPAAQKYKDFIANPDAFASAAAPVAAAGGAAKAAAVVDEPEDDEADMGFSLFD